jgi:sucrose phosphorylase
MLQRLQLLYGERADDLLKRIDTLADRYPGLRRRNQGSSLWDQRSVALITYGDQVSQSGSAALEAQRQFLLDYQIDTVINAVHVLPFFPYSSDDGFSVIDYRRVNPEVGDWPDVHRFAESFGMAFDFVVNHCSQHNEWFQRFLQGEEPYTNYFIDVDPSTDLSAVTRPRNTPLLTPYETNRGTKHVWTTFSADQIDLNLACPEVLLECLEILLLYIQYGAAVIRLDAIGFLWKQVGTTCMHLPQTHAVVKLMRDLVDDLAPGTILLTETNVPHEENISYFGDGDEAHAVYQFSLAPLLLDAFLTGDAGPLNRWLSGLEFPGEAMTFFNFTASHDGIGVRPLEGLVFQERLEGLVQGVRQRGGRVSMRTKPDGTESPYELNITYVSALDSPGGLAPEEHARKFLASQGLMLALRGVPGIYFHSLVGTRNYTEGVEQTGHNRTINRRKFQSDELREILSDEDSLQRKIFDGYRRMLSIRVNQPAFHPDADQLVLKTQHESLVALMRTSLNGNQRILVLLNVGEAPVTVDVQTVAEFEGKDDLLTGASVKNGAFRLASHDIAWLV